MRCLINVDGGMGKNVMLTAILPLVAQKYEEVYIISPYFVLLLYHKKTQKSSFPTLIPLFVH